MTFSNHPTPPDERHKLEFEQWLAEYGYGVSGRLSSPEGERKLRKLCARMNKYAMAYRESRKPIPEAKPDRIPRSPYAPNTFWDKRGQLVDVETSGGGKTVDYWGLHKQPLPEGYVRPQPIRRKFDSNGF